MWKMKELGWVSCKMETTSQRAKYTDFKEIIRKWWNTEKSRYTQTIPLKTQKHTHTQRYLPLGKDSWPLAPVPEIAFSSYYITFIFIQERKSLSPPYARCSHCKIKYYLCWKYICWLFGNEWLNKKYGKSRSSLSVVYFNQSSAIKMWNVHYISEYWVVWPALAPFHSFPY